MMFHLGIIVVWFVGLVCLPRWHAAMTRWHKLRILPWWRAMRMLGMLLLSHTSAPFVGSQGTFV
jgi:hypothetical protein